MNYNCHNCKYSQLNLSEVLICTKYKDSETTPSAFQAWQNPQLCDKGNDFEPKDAKAKLFAAADELRKLEKETGLTSGIRILRR